MVISLEDAVAILNKWKEESAHIFVAAESPFRQTLRGIHGHGVRWVMNQSVKVSRVSSFADTSGSKQGIVEFEGPAGHLSLSIASCRFVYGDPREARPEIRKEAESVTVSTLSVFFPSEEGFLFYELVAP